MTRALRSVFALVAAFAAAMAMLVWQAPASHAAACASAKSGVTVVVDYRSLGGGVVTACAPGDPGSALTALTSAGFSATRASREFSGYFLCRINGKPAADPCVKASPATAYWSFWHGPAGGSWTYSQVGVAGWDPQPGTAVGFSFGSGAQPGIKPPKVGSGSAPRPTSSVPAAPKPTATSSAAPKPTAKPTSAGGTKPSTSAVGSASTPAAQGTSSSPGGSQVASSTGSATAAPTATESGSTTSSSPWSTASASRGESSSAGSVRPGSTSATATSDAVAAGAPATTSSSSGTTPVAVGAGVVAVAGLGGAGLLAARRRRG